VCQVEKPVDEIWCRIEDWLAVNAPNLAVSFCSPATKRDVTKTERYLGVRFPDDVRASYLRHNGHWSLLAGWEWYSLDGLRRSWTTWKELFAEGSIGGKRHGEDDIEVRGDWWNPSWVPVFHLESDELCLDFAPGSEGVSGQVIQTLNGEPFGPVVVAEDFRELLANFADELEAGKLIALPDDGGSRDRSELDYIDSLGATLIRRGVRRDQPGWQILLSLARQFGWKPAGTKPPPEQRAADWDPTDYIILEGQLVTAADARSLASAFDHALAAIPEGDTIKSSVGIDPVLAYYTGPNRRQLADFAEYCRTGAFRVTQWHPIGGDGGWH